MSTLSITKTLTAGSANTILTIPTGYRGEVGVVMFANSGGASKTLTSGWVKTAGTVVFHSAALAADTNVQYDGNGSVFVVLESGEAITATPEAGSTISCLVTLTLIRQAPATITL